MNSITLSYSAVSEGELLLGSKPYRRILVLDSPWHTVDNCGMNLAVLLPHDSTLCIWADAPGKLYEIACPDQNGSPSAAVLMMSDCPAAFLQLFQSVYVLLSSSTAPALLGEQTVSLLEQWFIQLMPRQAASTPLPNHRQLAESARKIILAEYATDLTLEQVAERLYINSCYLSTMFRKHTGATFRSYLRSVRLEHARHLVLQTNMQITDIAMQVGFNSSAYLIRSFREVYHTTPMALRQQEYAKRKK